MLAAHQAGNLGEFLAVEFHDAPPPTRHGTSFQRSPGPYSRLN
jgi:hypothetical protein